MDRCQLLDERSQPDFRMLYGFHASRSTHLDAAVRRVRLGGMSLGSRELSGLHRLRLLVSEMNVLALSSEAEALTCDPARRMRVSFLVDLLGASRMQVRIAPLAGWSPDFSVFRPPPPRLERGRSDGADASEGTPGSPTLMIGPHWFERPYPHPGPALSVVVRGEAALRAGKRFEEIWERGHDIGRPLLSILRGAVSRGAEATAEG